MVTIRQPEMASQRAFHWQCKGQSSRRSCRQDLGAKAIAAKWRQAAARPARQRGRALLPGGGRPLPKGVPSSARLRRATRAAQVQCTAIKSRGVGRRARSATRGAVGTALDPRFVTVRNMIISVTMCSDMLFKKVAEKWLRIRNQKWQGFFEILYKPTEQNTCRHLHEQPCLFHLKRRW